MTFAELYPAVAPDFERWSIPTDELSEDGVVVLRQAGMSWRQCAAALCVPTTTLYKFAKKNGLLEVHTYVMPETDIVAPVATDRPAYDPSMLFANMQPIRRVTEYELENDLPGMTPAERQAASDRGELTDADIAQIDDAFAPVDRQRFENLVVGLPWSENMSPAVVDWVEENVAVAPSTMTPVQKMIADRLQDPDIKRVVVPMKPTHQTSARMLRLAAMNADAPLSPEDKLALVKSFDAGLVDRKTVEAQVGRDWDRIRSELSAMPVPPIEWADLDPAEQSVLTLFMQPYHMSHPGLSSATRMVVADIEAAEVLALLELVTINPDETVSLTASGSEMVRTQRRIRASLTSRGAEAEAAADRLIADSTWHYSLPDGYLWAMCGLAVAAAIVSIALIGGLL